MFAQCDKPDIKAGVTAYAILFLFLHIRAAILMRTNEETSSFLVILQTIIIKQ